MTVLAFKTFSGVAPKLTPWRLPPQMAQVAMNVDLTSRTLRPWNEPLTVLSPIPASSTASLYRFGLDLVSDTLYWFHWSQDVDAVRGPVVNDQSERTYYTGDGAPKVTNNTLAITGAVDNLHYPIDWRYLGVPAPATKPTVVASGTQGGSVDSRTYVYTYVTDWGEESAPSPASDILTVYSQQTVTISGFAAAPSDHRSITARRIYRSVSASTTDFYFVKEIAVGVSSTVDDTGAAIGEPCSTTSWKPPPSDMYGLCAMANGILVGFTKNTVHNSEQYVPYAWPDEYRHSTDYPIVGGATAGNQCVVLTTGHPYILSGVSSETMTLQKVPLPQSCVSKRSIVNIGNGVIYASPDGLVMIDVTGGAQVLTDEIMSRDDWQALNPESIVAYTYNNKYIAFYNNGVISGGFIFEPSQADAALSFTSVYATGGFSDLLQDALFIQVDDEIQKWDAGAAYLNKMWRSGITTLPKAENFGAAQVFASSYPVVFSLYGDDSVTPKFTTTVNNKEPFRLPSGFLAREYEVEFSGDGEVVQAYVATSMEELSRV